MSMELWHYAMNLYKPIIAINPDMSKTIKREIKHKYLIILY